MTGGDDDGATNTSQVPVRFRIFGYVLAAIVGIVVLPYFLFRTFVLMLRVFGREWRREFAKEFGRRHIKVSSDEMNEARLRHRP
jgi:hypothetical protein